jgi:hypothetical protein
MAEAAGSGNIIAGESHGITYQNIKKFTRIHKNGLRILGTKGAEDVPLTVMSNRRRCL